MSKHCFYYLTLIVLLVTYSSCTPSEVPDLLITNANIYPVSAPQFNGYIAIKDGRIIDMGEELPSDLNTINVQLIDAKGQFLMPGFIEGHGHFSSMGRSKNILNLNHSKNWDEILKQVNTKVKTSNPGEWIIGRGWHQEKWTNLPSNSINGYPHHHSLSQLTPDNPVLLTHASGHSLFANEKAMKLAGVSVEMSDPSGGSIVKDNHNKPIGVFTETAMDIIQDAHQLYLDSLPQEVLNQQWFDEIKLAEKECLQNGITSFQDAGSTIEEIKKYTQLSKDNDLDLRLWVMLYGGYKDIESTIAQGLHMYKNDFFQYGGVKAYVDGALGSRGAWLLAPYADRPNESGHNTMSLDELARFGQIAKDNNLQLCSHAIGDKGNREVLNVYEKVLKGKSKRWRIEHAQHLDSTDINRFSGLNVLASVQTNHCTSDAPYVEKRLGKRRAKEGAYVWKKLLNSGAKVNIGTDVPVEDIDPIANFYAAVTRKIKGVSIAFFEDQCLTREEAIYGYTIANAYACFQEKEKGDLALGKMADLVLLSNNLLTCSEEEILTTQVMMTIIDGKVVYEK